MIGKLASLWRRRKARDGGSAATEFALCVPVLTVLVFGAADYGVMGYHQSEVIAATRAGAQYALGNQSQDKTGWSIPNTLLPTGMTPGASAKFNPATLNQVCACVKAPLPVTPTAAACSATCTGGTLVGYVKVNAEIDGYTAFLSSVVPFFGNFGIPTTLAGQAILRAP
jgi:Flp pilus assembly protein TadG